MQQNEGSYKITIDCFEIILQAYYTARPLKQRYATTARLIVRPSVNKYMNLWPKMRTNPEPITKIKQQKKVPKMLTWLKCKTHILLYKSDYFYGYSPVLATAVEKDETKF